MYRDGTIPYQRFRAWELSGQTAGVVGLGAVGRATKWRLEGLGMRVIAYDPFAAEATHTLDDLLSEADVVTMHPIVTPETTGMIGAEQFARMKEGAVFVNTARAMLHDTDALVAALQSGHLGGAGLDHFVGELSQSVESLTPEGGGDQRRVSHLVCQGHGRQSRAERCSLTNVSGSSAQGELPRSWCSQAGRASWCR